MRFQLWSSIAVLSWAVACTGLRFEDGNDEQDPDSSVDERDGATSGSDSGIERDGGDGSVDHPCPAQDEVCNGRDDDCDRDIDEDFTLAAACDGVDIDLCRDGVTVCNAAGDGVECDDDTSGMPDVCDGEDNDCDPSSADGSADDRVGRACDGQDTDLCEEGTYSCGAQGLICSDDSGSTKDVCNDEDDDCDSSSADGSEDPLADVPCDGTDSDLCEDGVYQCASGAQMACNDDDASAFDLCDGTDDDCDPDSADGTEDPMIGMVCEAIT